MVDVTKVHSGGLYETKESYSRLVMVDNWIFMANTAGRNLTTREMSEDPIEQAKQAFSNIERALAQVGATLADVVRSHVHIQYQPDAPSVMAFVGEKFKGIDPASTVTCGPWAGRNTRSRSRSPHTRAPAPRRRTGFASSSRQDLILWTSRPWA
jgi:enamine deaminase RidA (YjgF/YER057c/UK114 family)